MFAHAKQFILPFLLATTIYWCSPSYTQVAPVPDSIHVKGDPKIEVITKQGFTLGYFERHEQPAWVSYKLTRQSVRAKRVSRKRQEFREDPEVSTGSATLSDYRHSGYDRGHLAPAASMAYSKQVMSESFLLSNVSPQNREFNAGIWADLEQKVRYWATVEGEVYVVTGPILPKVKTHTIGASQVTVPTAFYKAVLAPRKGGKAIGFVIPNKPTKRPLKDFTVTIDDIEQQTGLDFFSALPDDKEQRIEGTYTLDAWKW